MALAHSLLAALALGPASGYDLSKVFDSGMSDFWRASSQQIYTELHKLDDRGLIEGTLQQESNRPQKRVYVLTDAGRTALHEFTRTAPRRPVIRDEMMVKLYAVDAADVEAVIEDLSARATEAHLRVEQLRQLVAIFRDERSHEEFLSSGGPIGPYLTCLLGIAHELDNAKVCAWIAEVLRAREDDSDEPPPPDPIKFGV